MAPADPQTARLVLGYQAATARVRAAVEDYVRLSWTGLGDWRDPSIDRWISQVAPVMAAGRHQTAQLTDVYLSALESTTFAERVTPAGIPASATAVSPRGIPDGQLWRRPAETVWTALADGKPLDVAVRLGEQRALSLAGTDLQLTRTHTARNALASSDRVVGYRRSLSGGESCGLCIVASTQRYHRGDLMPIHPACNCGIIPIYGDRDPGQVIDPERLDRVHEAIEERFGASDPGARAPVDYRDVLLTVDHGEIGPVLAVRGHTHTGPADLF